MITIKRAVSVMLCLSLLTAGTLAAATTTAGASMTIDERLADLDLDTEDYPEGRVLVTLAAKSIPGSDLLAEGCVTDDDLVIEDVMDFGEAVDVARTSTEKKDFREKTLYVSVVTSDDLSTDELVEKLKNEDDVISVTPDYRLKKMTDDTIFNGQWALGGTDYKVLGGAPKVINYYDEKTASASGSSVVCVVDDGIDYTHEDLKDVMWDNPYTSSGLLGTHGYDFVNGDEDPIPTYSDDDHGTHVAGIIAAQTDNQKGVAGVSASASLMALKVFDDRNDSSGLTSVILQAYEYIYQAMELGVNVSAINCSFGNDPSDRYT